MIKIINDDVIEALKKIEDNSIDLIFVDPPYNIGKKYANEILDKWKCKKEYLNWMHTWLELAVEKLNKTGSLYIMNSTENIPHVDIYLQESDMHILSRIVWHYDSSGVQAKKYYGSLYEPILFAVKNKKNYTFNHEDIMIETVTGAKRNLIDYRKTPPQPYNKKKVPGNAWYYPRVRYMMKEYVKHPSQKPEAMLERIVKASSNKGDIVLDLFAGSFSLGVVSKRLGRNYIGIEKSEEYCKTGENRIGIK